MAVTLTVPSTEARSSHVSDSTVQPFLQPDFDPVDYLNNTLPALSTSSISRNTSTATRAVPLPELSSQIQGLLTRLNAQTTRLSNALTQLTDEILRSGGRLAYEVEVLRGETIGLTDSLDNGLKKDIEVFTKTHAEDNAAETGEVDGDTAVTAQTGQDAEPEYLTQLKTLTAVRERLDSVIKIFGEAMQWPLAPSDLSLTSSLISVSAPDSGDDSRSREEKGKAYVEKLRTEINDLLGPGNNAEGLETASARIDELRQLAEVWKGTAEEKARLKLVESLQKPVEERQKALGQAAGSRKPNPSPSRGMDYRYGNPDSSRAGSEGGYGFLQNLRNLKNDMYLD
ncbi:uncharacterized protein LTR77_000565 [Saxophila tyrrhenica]|uniref:Uncharacterized protein n=1 Tax=Saxophila tyrrhenica TaxID=1690608 RepID=A0AAV9PNQ5_9PEZI|nr:hypothetical protein LTR77_000565 [Saxophila tyrrhenica]